MNIEKFFLEYWPALVSGVLAIASAITAIVVKITDAKKIGYIAKALEDAKSRETQVLCPKCGKKSPLSECSFFLPTGEMDNDLNGVAD